jgi:hypothetical protein
MAQRKTTTTAAAKAAPAKAAPAKSKPAAPAKLQAPEVPAPAAPAAAKVDITSRVGAYLIDQGGTWADRVGEVAPRKSGKRTLHLDATELRELAAAVQGMAKDGTALDQRAAAALLGKLPAQGA